MENQVFQESLWRLFSKHFGGFQGRSKSEKGCPRRLERSPVECLSDAENLRFRYYINTRAFAAKPEFDMYFYTKHSFHCYTFEGADDKNDEISKSIWRYWQRQNGDFQKISGTHT